MNKYLIIISIIITIISFIYIILNYFGIIRYIYIHLRDPENFIQNYIKKKSTNKNFVVISIAVSPENISLLKPTINSLLDQTVKVNNISIAIKSEDKNQVPISNYLRRIAQINITKKDYGTSFPIIPELLRAKNNNTIIIVLKPGVIYGKDFIEQILDKNEKETNKMIKSKDAVLIKPSFFKGDCVDCKLPSTNDWLKKNIKVDLIEMNYLENYPTLIKN